MATPQYLIFEYREPVLRIVHLHVLTLCLEQIFDRLIVNWTFLLVWIKIIVKIRFSIRELIIIN